MSRKATNTILACLLCLLPTLSIAQTLQRIEYWFDDNLASRKTISLSGTEDGITQSLSTDGLDNGLHKFSFRIRRTDNVYSAISTSLFFKQNDNVGEVLEYWLDDDYEHRVSMGLSGTTEEQELTFDLHDPEFCPLGFHQLNFRVAAGGKGMSAVYTTGIIKIPSGKATQVEYWFDNNQANAQVLDGHLSSDNKAYIINADLDVSQLSVGMHRLNYRACDKANNFYGAILSAPILKVPSGNASILEYWLDGNMSTRKQFSGSTTDGGYKYISDLDLGNVSPGHHRLSVRAKSSDGKRVTAVNTVPIIVKSRYGNGSEPVDAKMTKYSISVDNEESVVLDVLTPKETITIPYTLDARSLSKGSHTIKSKFWNSANAGVSTEDQFTVVEQEGPVLTLTAAEKDGVVDIRFNSIPNDIRYRVGRTDQNGKNTKVYETTSGQYPNKLHVVDSPMAGSYTYFVRAVYEDADGTAHAVQSNDANVNVTTSDETNRTASILGRVVFDNNMTALVPSNANKIIYHLDIL